MYNPIRKYQQGGEANPEQVMQQIAQMLQQQIPPQQIMEQLQQMGIQPQQAQQMIQQVAQSMQQAPEQPQMQQGGRAAMDNTYHRFHKDPVLDETFRKENLGVKDYNTSFKPSYNFDSTYSKKTPDFLDSSSYRKDFNNAKTLFSRPSRLTASFANHGSDKEKHKNDTDLEWMLKRALPHSEYSFATDPSYLDRRDELINSTRNEKNAYEDWLNQAKGKFYDSSGNLKKEYNTTGAPKVFPKMQQGGYNPYLLDEETSMMMKGGMHKMPNGMMMKNSMMQSGGKINYADFPPERTIMKREELYKGANPNMSVYQDTYGDGRKDITYQDKKTGKMMSNPWATKKDSTIDRSITGSLDLQSPKFVPMQSVTKMKKGGMKKWSY